MDKYVFDDREEMLKKNKGLIYSIIKHQFKKTQDSPEYDDLASVGMIGLIKAVDTFDKSKDIKFATYASHCIFNEIAMYFRKYNKFSQIASFEDIIVSNSEGDDLTIEDKIADPNSDFTDNILIKEEFTAVINVALNILSTKEKIVMFYWFAGWKQKQIEEVSGLEQSYVSKLTTGAQKKIRDCINTNSYYKKVISFSIDDDEYVFVFSLAFSDDFYAFFEKVEIDNINQQVTIRLKANLTYLSCVADFFVAIYKIEKNISKPKRTSREVPQSKKISEYILNNLDLFTISEVKDHFINDFTYYNVCKVIRRLKELNFIIKTERGKYKVIKSNIQKYE